MRHFAQPSFGTADTSRGCPFACSFCTIINVQGRKSRRRTPDDVEAVVADSTELVRALDTAPSVLTAQALFWYTVGLWAFSTIRVVVAAFYALQDTKTPVRIAVVALIVNTVFSVALMFPMKHSGLAFATSIASAVEALSSLIIDKTDPLQAAIDALPYPGGVVYLSYNALPGWRLLALNLDRVQDHPHDLDARHALHPRRRAAGHGAAGDRAPRDRARPGSSGSRSPRPGSSRRGCCTCDRTR